MSVAAAATGRFQAPSERHVELTALRAAPMELGQASDAAGLLADRILSIGGCISTPPPTRPHPGSLPMRWRIAFRPRAWFISAKGNALGSAVQDEPCRPRACLMTLRPVIRLEWTPQGSPPGIGSRFQR